MSSVYSPAVRRTPVGLNFNRLDDGFTAPSATASPSVMWMAATPPPSDRVLNEFIDNDDTPMDGLFNDAAYGSLDSFSNFFDFEGEEPAFAAPSLVAAAADTSASLPVARDGASAHHADETAQQVAPVSAVATSTARAPSKRKKPVAAAKKKKTTARKRTRMPVEEQKLRNCLSAKRSREKKNRALAEATAEVARLTAENKALRARMAQARELVLSQISASHSGAGCETSVLDSIQQTLSPLAAESSQ